MELEKMKITIITTTYNSAATIKDTFESVLRQTYADYEYLVIDGASEDDTVGIIRQYEPEFKGRMKWISEKDKGIYDAMNKGISLATGDVVGVLNSDDFFTSDDILEAIACAFDGNDTDAVYGDVHFVNADNLKKCVRYYSSRIFRPSLMRFGLMPAHPSFYLKRKRFEEIGLYDTSYKIASDFEFLLRAFCLHGIKAVYVKKDFVTMRTGGASTANMGSRWIIMKEHLRAFRSNRIHTNVFLLSMRYFYKVYELVGSRIR